MRNDEKKRAWWKSALIWVAEVFDDFYIIAFAALIVWARFVESSSNFFNAVTKTEDIKTHAVHVLTDYSPDYIIDAIWLTIPLWLFVHKKVQKINKKEAQEELDTSLAGVRHISTGRIMRKFIEECHKQLKKLEDISSVADPQAQNKKIAEIFSVIDLSVKDITCHFFNLEKEKIGLNYMLYVDTSELNQQTLASLLAKDSLYVRDGYKMDGVLYLEPKLNNPILEESKLSTLTIPLYARNQRIYNNPENNDEVNMPGAPSAFFDGSYIIANTRDVKSYSDINIDTQKEIISYFKTKQYKTYTLMSFCVPKSENNTPVGVLNIEGSKKSAFMANDNISNTFYAIIYSVLIHMDQYLRIYKNNLIPLLQSSPKPIK